MSKAKKVGMRLFPRKKKSARNKVSPPKPLATADWNTKFDDILGEGPVQLHFWPAYSANPYQNLLYGRPTERFSANPNPIDQARVALDANSSGTVCFHLHWLNFLYDRNDEEITRANVSSFLACLRQFVEAGGVFLWTMHNLREHERVDGDLELGIRREIVELAHGIFVHGGAAKAALCAEQPEAREKVRIIDHGHYIGVYPDEISRSAAREALALSSDETVLVSLGWLRRYKGLSTLCEAVEQTDDLKLVVAGRARGPEVAAFNDMLSGYRKTRAFEGWIPDEQIQLYMNAADFVVLPYVASTTSGAALLALSFGVPVIAPRIGAFPEIIEDGVTGFLYDPDPAEGLTAALLRARETSAAERSEMRVSAFRTASALTWSSARHTLFETLVHRQS